MLTTASQLHFILSLNLHLRFCLISVLIYELRDFVSCFSNLAFLATHIYGVEVWFIL